MVDGGSPHPGVVADRLADTLTAVGRPSARLTDTAPLADEDTWRADRTPQTVVIADGPRWRAHPPTGKWDVVVWLRTPPAGARTHGGHGRDCDVVIDLHDPGWPVIRHLADRLAPWERWYVSESRAFFAIRAATWDSKFGEDLPAYTAAVTEAHLPAGGVAVDIGCGTGRALPALRHAVGPTGTVIGLDLTPQMLAAAQRHGRDTAATLLLGDARRLPFRDAAVDGVFAAGLITHLPDPEAGLRELARITRPGGRLVLFHPSGRAALAARHGRTLDPDEPLAETPLRRSTIRAGWDLTSYDDPAHRFLATATRQPR
ncbi:hypothetical protein GCM10022225_76440 [Plantactinospora mayteni]|uniref:Methyltransferase type 11 domain-containing protein n=1 Tax=Plantactinospora mayteni TaxID=566021 RepID=A0ABQ4F2B8_9ACTN|nr:hypothetical protein Pma05_75950 [Plantactinospora mayteni]